MKNLVNITKQSDTSIKVDVTAEAARKARAFGREAQRVFTHQLVSTMGYTVQDEQYGMRSIVVRGKRGVSNDGFQALVFVEAA